MMVQRFSSLLQSSQPRLCFHGELITIRRHRLALAPSLHTSSVSMKKEKKSTFRKIFVNKEDLNKRPSDLEIKKKDLPSNTPTLGERIDRDVYRLFHQSTEKQGYHNIRKHPDSMKTELIEYMKKDFKADPKESIKKSFKAFAVEVGKFAEETRRNQMPSETVDLLPRPGDRRVEWDFTQPEVTKDWILTKDSDWGEGYSHADMSMGGAGHAVFSGNLSTRVPADGRTQAAGYANICSPVKRKSFARVEFLDWQYFTHLTMNIKGDGRKYMLNLHVYREFDLTWGDRWHYPLYTRGGPYWQYVKIPWNKFFLGSRGTLQDKQDSVPLHLATGVSITLQDITNGPFQLEIKDIGYHFDDNPDHDETFVYETYKTPLFWHGY